LYIGTSLNSFFLLIQTHCIESEVYIEYTYIIYVKFQVVFFRTLHFQVAETRSSLSISVGVAVPVFNLLAHEFFLILAHTVYKM